MKRKIKIPKPRNPFVVHIATKRSGAHVKTYKSKRAAQKMRDKKDYFSDTLVQYGVK